MEDETLVEKSYFKMFIEKLYSNVGILRPIQNQYLFVIYTIYPSRLHAEVVVVISKHKNERPADRVLVS